MSRPITKLADIESAAIRLFARRGMVAVTIKDIAAEAGCAEGALYRHYASKEEMAWTLFRREVEKFAFKLREIWFGPGDAPAKLTEGIRLFYTFFDEDPTTFTFILLSQFDFPPEKKLHPELSPEPLVMRFVSEGIRRGEFRYYNAQLGAALVLGLVLYPAIQHAKGNLRGRLALRVESVAAACLKVLVAKGWK